MKAPFKGIDVAVVVGVLMLVGWIVVEGLLWLFSFVHVG